jgi:hypothetical protein
MTVAEYAAEWLALIRVQRAPRTARAYESVVRLHIAPTLGTRPIRDLTRRELKRFAVTLLGEAAMHRAVGPALGGGG